jgi:hypothetical protein
MEKELFMISPPHKDCLFATLLEKGWPTHTHKQRQPPPQQQQMPSVWLLATLLEKEVLY